MKRLFKFKYPKIALFIIFVIIAYILFSHEGVRIFVSQIEKLGYFSSFLGGILFALGFSAPIAAGFFLTTNPDSIILAAIIGGLGATITNISLFHIIKYSFKDEFDKLRKSKLIKELEKEAEKEEELFFHRKLIMKLNHYMLYVFAGILIASPLPDEFGTIMLASLTHIKAIPLAIITFILSTIGIFILLCF